MGLYSDPGRGELMIERINYDGIKILAFTVRTVEYLSSDVRQSVHRFIDCIKIQDIF